MLIQKQKLLITLTLLLFASLVIFFKQKTGPSTHPVQQDFDLICQVYTDLARSLKLNPTKEAAITSSLYQKLEAGIQTPSIKETMEAIHNAAPIDKYILFQKTAQDFGLTWSCPEMEAFLNNLE